MADKKLIEISPKLISPKIVANVLTKKYGLNLVKLPKLNKHGVESAVWSIDSKLGKFYYKVFSVKLRDCRVTLLSSSQ